MTTVVYSIAPCFGELVDDLRDGRLLLADGDVEAEDVLPFWLMIVSIATAVLPVWRSPMMSSSRCPR